MSGAILNESAHAKNENKNEIRRDDHVHVFHSWSAQAEIEPLAVAGGQGSWFWDYDGHRYLDFASQLINVNIGHQHPKLIAAIQKQLHTLSTIAPAFANKARSESARRIAELAPSGLNKVFFTNGGTDANEHAIRMARVHTGRSKILAAYRSYHGATSGSIALTGEPRRWGSESSGSAMPNVVHFWGPYLYRSSFHSHNEAEECERALEHLRSVITVEGPNTIAAIILETVVGANGILVPPDGYLAGVREICDQHGIVMIADEVMAGFGRCGEWFAINRWDVAPDLITFAKGCSSGYIPIGGVIISDAIATTFDHLAYPGGLTYSGHLLGCAAVAASIEIFRTEHILENVRMLSDKAIEPGLRALMDRHPSIGEVRGLGVFWAIELVTDRTTRQPFVPFNARKQAAAPMRELIGFCNRNGLWVYTHFNCVHISPPCTATAEEVREGMDILDHALDIADRHCTG